MNKFQYFKSGFVPVNEGGRIYLILTVAALTPSRSVLSIHLLPQVNSLQLLLHLSLPCFLCLTLLSWVIHLKLKHSSGHILHPSFLNTSPYHCTPFPLASCSTNFSNPNIPIKSSALLLSNSFYTTHCVLFLSLSVLLKIAIRFLSDTTSLTSYKIAYFMQLQLIPSFHLQEHFPWFFYIYTFIYSPSWTSWFEGTFWYHPCYQYHDHDPHPCHYVMSVTLVSQFQFSAVTVPFNFHMSLGKTYIS